MLATLTGKGFIGSHLFKTLQERDIPVYELDWHKLPTLTEKQLPESDYIFHLSAYGQMAHQTEPEMIFQANVVNLFNLLEASLGSAKIINFSTSSVNQKKQTMYSLTKAFGERLCEDYEDVITVRPCSIFGTGEADFRLIPTICRSIVKGEKIDVYEGSHDWLSVDVFCESLVDNVIEMNELIYNVTSGKQQTNFEILQLLEEVAGKKANAKKHKGKLRNWDSDKWELPEGNFTCNQDIKTELLKTFEYYKQKYE